MSSTKTCRHLFPLLLLLLNLVSANTEAPEAEPSHLTTPAQHVLDAGSTHEHALHAKKFNRKLGRKFRKHEVEKRDGDEHPSSVTPEVPDFEDHSALTSTTESTIQLTTEEVIVVPQRPSERELPENKSPELVVESETVKPKPKYKLIYFDARGICESIRLLFRYANQSFVDERITRKKWLAMKDTTFYGKIPILEVDGKPLAQCYAISRFLARQFDLIGRDDWEAAKLDEAADFHKYVLTELSPYLFVMSGYRSGDRDALRKELFVPVVDKNFPIYVNLLKAANSGFFGKSGVSWVDFVVSEYMTTIRHYEPAILEKYPLLLKFVERVQNLPQICEYIRQRNHTPLQFQL